MMTWVDWWNREWSERRVEPAKPVQPLSTAPEQWPWLARWLVARIRVWMRHEIDTSTTSTACRMFEQTASTDQLCPRPVCQPRWSASWTKMIGNGWLWCSIEVRPNDYLSPSSSPSFRCHHRPNVIHTHSQSVSQLGRSQIEAGSRPLAGESKAKGINRDKKGS